jgi:hypothetical protein
MCPRHAKQRESKPALLGLVVWRGTTLRHARSSRGYFRARVGPHTAIRRLTTPQNAEPTSSKRALGREGRAPASTVHIYIVVGVHGLLLGLLRAIDDGLLRTIEDRVASEIYGDLLTEAEAMLKANLYPQSTFHQVEAMATVGNAFLTPR